MATKFYSGNASSGKVMDGYVFTFEAVDITSGSWYGVYKTDDTSEQAALDKLVSKGQVSSLTKQQYDDCTKKKLERQSLSPQLKGVSEQQVVDRAEDQTPKQSIEDEDDVLEVKQVAKPKSRKSKKK
jgi:hypothetical protein|tara:strand:+ start:14935 stop:15315 length:381 start_codon:yes stop_codon:yes gene_type:complete